MKIYRYEALRGANVLVTGVMMGVAIVGTFVGAVANNGCAWHSLLDYWLLGIGVTTVGAVVGVVIWLQSLTCTKVINGPRCLMMLLLVVNVIWLILGNIAVSLIIVSCGAEVNLWYEVNCSSYLISFTLAIVIIIDILYAIFLLMVCLSYGGTCQDQPAFTSLNKASVVVWWVGVLTLLVTLGIGVACIVVGASYCPACCDQDWISTWHIFFGVVTVVFVVMLVYKVRDYNHLDASWVAPQEALVLPIAVLAILLLSAIFVGYLWLAESREEACSGSAPCSSDLTTFSVVVIVLLSLPLLVFFYVTAAVGLLTAFFVILSFIYYCSGDAMHQEVKILHEK